MTGQTNAERFESTVGVSELTPYVVVRITTRNQDKIKDEFWAVDGGWKRGDWDHGHLDHESLDHETRERLRKPRKGKFGPRNPRKATKPAKGWCTKSARDWMTESRKRLDDDARESLDRENLDHETRERGEYANRGSMGRDACHGFG